MLKKKEAMWQKRAVGPRELGLCFSSSETALTLLANSNYSCWKENIFDISWTFPWDMGLAPFLPLPKKQTQDLWRGGCIDFLLIYLSNWVRGGRCDCLHPVSCRDAPAILSVVLSSWSFCQTCFLLVERTSGSSGTTNRGHFELLAGIRVTDSEALSV